MNFWNYTGAMNNIIMFWKAFYNLVAIFQRSLWYTYFILQRKPKGSVFCPFLWLRSCSVKWGVWFQFLPATVIQEWKRELAEHPEVSFAMLTITGTSSCGGTQPIAPSFYCNAPSHQVAFHVCCCESSGVVSALSWCTALCWKTELAPFT